MWKNIKIPKYLTIVLKQIRIYRTSYRKTFQVGLVFVIIVALVYLLGDEDDGLPKCAENYSPCTCKLDLDYGKVVHCSSSAVSSPEQLKDTFLRLQLSGYIMDLYEFTLNLPSNKENGATIPANMMGRNNRAGIVKITCPSTDYRLKIDPDAFRSSGDRMFYLSISDCNLSQTDWSFLDGFTKMSLLSIANSIIIVPDDLVASLSPDLVPTMTVEVNGKIVRNLF